MANDRSHEFEPPPPPSSTRGRGQYALDGIRWILARRFEIPWRGVNLHSRFVEDLGIDAFDLPDLILALEEAFEVDIPTVAAARVSTVKDAVICVLRREREGH